MAGWRTRQRRAREAQRAGRDKKRRRGVLDLPKAIEERLAEGRAERESVPLEAHGEWATPDQRPDPVGILEKQNATRVPELVPIRHGRMIVSPFVLPRDRGDHGVRSLAQRDDRVACAVLRRCAPVELRAVRGARSPRVFDLNDFDETLPAPLSGTSSASWPASSSPPATTATVARSSGRRRALPPRPIGPRWPRRRGCASWMSGTRGSTRTSCSRISHPGWKGRDQVLSEGPCEGADADEPARCRSTRSLSTAATGSSSSRR